MESQAGIAALSLGLVVCCCCSRPSIGFQYAWFRLVEPNEESAPSVKRQGPVHQWPEIVSFVR